MSAQSAIDPIVCRGIISIIPVLVESMLLTLLAMTIDPNPIQLLSPTIVDLGISLQLQFGITTHGLVLAEQFQNTDILGNIQTGWTDFLQTGKAGTLAIGLVMGYMIRGITR
jgi:hypothetical protein